jgi:hypothetical protein
MCDHLLKLDLELKNRNIKEISRGQSWGDNCREWVYYDCVLNLEKLKERFAFPDFVTTHINNDERSGLEAGFCCDLCKDAVMGIHPKFGAGKIHVE